MSEVCSKKVLYKAAQRFLEGEGARPSGDWPRRMLFDEPVPSVAQVCDPRRPAYDQMRRHILELVHLYGWIGRRIYLVVPDDARWTRAVDKLWNTSGIPGVWFLLVASPTVVEQLMPPPPRAERVTVKMLRSWD